MSMAPGESGAKSLGQFGRIYAAPLWRWYFGGIITLIGTNIIVLEIPQLAKTVINALAGQLDLEGLTSLTIVIIALGVLQVAIRTASRMLIFWPGRTLEARIKDDIFAHILRLPPINLVSFNVGDLASRLNNDVTQLRIFFAFGALQVLNVIFISIFTISKMASIDWVLTALAISPMVFMLFLTKLTMPRLYKAMRENTEALGRISGKIAEIFSNIQVIQAMNIPATMIERLNPDNDAIFNSNLRTIWLRTLIWPVMTILLGLSQFATLGWGGHQIMAGHLTVGDIMAFNIYIGMLTFPFASLGIILNVYQRAKPASERLQLIRQITEEGEHDTAGAKINELATSKYLLEVKDLCFQWPDGRAALSHISFSIKPGERVGIFGAIGSGKSTLFHLLTRLYDHSAGQILLANTDLRTIPIGEVRRRISYGLQQPLLFSESVRSNLCLGLTEGSYSDQDLVEATRRAEILDDIMRLPDKWETPIGEKGIKLSGGQKQRLALARILLRRSDLIILDDVLSAVDHDTERKLTKSLHDTKSALLIASHRISILEPCDKILIMKEGRIVATGKFDDVKVFIEQNLAAAHEANSDGSHLS